MTERYINLFTDFGFKKVFGEEPNKPLLISFINCLLPEEAQVVDLTYLKSVVLGNNVEERARIFDLYCKNKQGDRFIVEVQQLPQEYFVDRTLYYVSGAIQQQAERGRKWNYELRPTYVISVLNFSFDRKRPQQLDHRVQLIETTTNRLFYDKLLFIYLEIPKFNKTIAELETDYDRWLFAFKALHQLDKRPPAYKAAVFERLFEVAKIANMSTQERQRYQESLKQQRDAYATTQTAIRMGIEQGEENVLRRLVISALKKGWNKARIIEIYECTEVQYHRFYQAYLEETSR